jgi:2-keto-4-pentenoate hydratase
MAAPRQFDSRVLAGLERQLDDMRGTIARANDRIGWKIGLNVPQVQESLGIEYSVIGHLTSATLLEPGGSVAIGDMQKPLIEPEVAVRLRRPVEAGAETDEALAAIESLGAAIELVDLPAPPNDVGAAVAGNVFHRGVVLGPQRQDAAVNGVEAVVRVNGEERDRADAQVDLADTIGLVADLLGAAGELLEAGDTIICGSLTPPVPVQAGQTVEVELGVLGTVGLGFER